MSVILVFCSVFIAVYALIKCHKIFLCGLCMPGPWAIPLVGNLQFITRLSPEKMLATINGYRENVGKTFRLWVGPQLWIFLHSPEETRAALNDNSLNRPATFQLLEALIGNGLLVSKGRFWELHRKALNPAFHPSILNGFTLPITQHVETFIEILKSKMGQPIEVTSVIFPCVMDAILDTSMGKNLELQKDESHKYTHAFHRTSELLFQRMVNPLLFPDFIYRRTKSFQELQRNIEIIHNLMNNIILERQQNQNIPLENSKIPKCLLDTLLTAEIEGHPMTLKEIRDEVNTFMFAGVDTTTAAMSFILYALGKYPLEQEKLLNELQQNHLDAKDAVITTTDLNNLEYLEMFIKECLRLYTIVPMTGRQTTQATKIGKHNYPSGITIWVNIYGLAHDSAIFPQPYEFRPSRFERHEYQRLPKFSFLPFSGGGHFCIGRKYAMMIMKIMCIRLVQNFEIYLQNPREELQLAAQMVLKAVNGINVVFKQRNNKE